VITAKPLCIIQPGKQKSVDLAGAVIAGCNGGEVMTGNVAPADIHPSLTPVIIGVHPTTVDTLHALKRARRPFVTVDNGYFRPYKEGGYFRATTNALQWITSRRGTGFARDVDCTEEGKARFDALDLPALLPWQEKEEPGHILVVLQSPVWLEMMNEPPGWARHVMTKLRLYTDREIVLRHKPLKGSPPQPSLDEHLAGAWAVVGYSSNVLIQAAMRGIPICSTGFCASSPMGCSVVESLMHGPTYRERESILHNLAANQWTIAEIASGKMWRELQDRYEPDFVSLA